MCLSVFGFKKYLLERRLVILIVTGLLFLLLSIEVYMAGIEHWVISFLLGLLDCCSIVTLTEKVCENGRKSVVFGILYLIYNTDFPDAYAF